MLEACERRGPRAPVVTADQHHIRVCLGHARCYGTNPHLGDELHAHPRLRVCVLEVIDQLCQILDGVDIVVWWWRDQTDTGSSMPHTSYLPDHLIARKLPPFARLRALGHLDLQLFGIHQVLTRHPETGRGHLLYRAASPVAVSVAREARRVLAPLTGVTTPTYAVHGDGEVLVCLLGYGSEGHSSGHKPG